MTVKHDCLEISFSIQSSSPMRTIESHIQVQHHSTRTFRNESFLRKGGGGFVYDRTAITSGATSLILKYCPTLIGDMSNLTIVHRLDVVAYLLTREGLYMSITSPFICSSLVMLLSSLHYQTLCPSSLKLPSLSIIPPARITCVIAC